MQPDPSQVLETLSISVPLIGFYDAPDPEPFEPLVVPEGRQCLFAAFEKWREGRTLHLTEERAGCAGGHLFGEGGMPREKLVDFLCEEEGLRENSRLMNLWLDSAQDYHPIHGHLLFGPLRPEQYEYLRTVTFYVNADQLAILATGATYYSRPDDVEPILSRFGSGCMQLATLFDDIESPQAIIGSTDQAMRQHLEPWMLAFTVTKPMFELLCRWGDDPRSSLHSGFTRHLIEARGGTLA
ncbi:MAG: DUF169 domain-containing protein [Thermoleophilia bacterium]|nr:DUF169 domain-containing protein [Thermoleophilia bacterium]